MKNLRESLKSKSGQFGIAWANRVIQYRWWVLISTLLFAFLVGAGSQYVGFNSDYHVFFSEDNPQLQAYDALQNKYTKDDNVFIVIEPEDGKVFTQETLSAIEALTVQSWQTPYSTRVDAITNFQHTRAVGDDLYVEDLVEDAMHKSDQEIAAIRKVALHEPQLKNRLVNEEGTLTAINITVKMPGENIEEGNEIMAYVREMVAGFEAENPHLKTYLSGMIMLSGAFQEASSSDMQTLVPLMFLIIILTILLATRTVSGTFASLLVIIMSIVTAMGAAGWLGIQLTPPSSAFMTIVLTLAVADSIHILITFVQQMRKGLSQREAIVESLRVNFMPVFITSLTTVIGFLSMNFSDAPPFHDLGNLTSIGMTAAFLYSVLTLPALVTILPVRIQQKTTTQNQKPPFLERLAEVVIRHDKKILWGSTLSVIVLSLLVFNNELNEEFVKYFDEDITFRQDTDYISENLTGIYTVEFSLGASESGGINNPEYLAKVEAFENWLYQQDEVVHVNAFTEVARRVNKSMHGDSISYYRMPTYREEAAQYLLLYEMSLPFGLDLNNQVNVDKSETRLIVTAENLSSQQLLEFTSRAEGWLADNAPQTMFAQGTSTAIMFSHLTKRQLNSMMSGNMMALVLISMVLMIALRSVRYGALSLVPNIAPVLVGFGIWGVTVGLVNTGISIVFGMTLGIIVDDTVHFLSKYLRARRELNKSPEDAVRYAFATVGQALVVTSIVLVSGFFVLAQSSFAMNSGMAKITVLIISLALILDFLMLPAILLRMSKAEAVSGEAEQTQRALALK